MALFKILRGNSSKLFNSSGGISSTVPFNDGYCYFTPDNKKFYIDWLDESNGQHRDPLNSFLTDKLLSSWTDINKVQHTGSAKLVGFTDGAAIINDSNEEIPTSAVLYAKFSEVEDTLAALDNDKMDKVNPTGTGYFSLNRKTGHTPGLNSVAVGDQTTASGVASFAEGYHTTASEDCSHAEGVETTASGWGSHAEGGSTTASGEGSHAEGGYTVASGQGSHAEGGYTIASEIGSHAEGGYTIASGLCSHAEGWNTTANHKAQHTEGEYNIADTSTAKADARGTYVHIVGNGTADDKRSNALTLTWGGDLWHSGKLAHGNSVTAEGSYSYSGGSETSAIGNYSHAEGVKTVARGASSHAEGESTSAVGTASHAEGLSSIAQGNYSHAQNQGTLANGNAQTAIGKFNVADNDNKLAFIIGNGADTSHRSNMFFIDWNGNACFLNTLLVGTNATTPSKIADAKFYVEGKSYFNGDMIVTGNLTASAAPSNDDHLVNKKYVDDNLMRLTHHYIKAKDGQANFDFGTVGVNDITNYYLVYFNGLLLIEGIHYSISNKSVVNLLGWSATADDYLQLVGFKPNNPTTLNKGGV